MKEPDIVPEKLSNPVNLYVIIGILIIGGVIHAVLNLVPEEDVGILAFTLSTSLSAGVAIFAFIVAKQHETGILAKSYFYLGLGYTSYFIAESLYYLFELVLEIEAYPSIADIFFFALYPVILTYLIVNIKFFGSGYSKFQKIWIPLIPLFAIISYVIMWHSVPDAELNFDFYYGLIFIIGASTALSFTIVGALIFKEGTVGTVWLLLVIGMMINVVCDIWYYNLEIFGEYFDGHLVTAGWFLSNMFMIYALFKQMKDE